MATTKIWAIKGELSKVLNYASNPNKTTLKSLEQVLKYATNEEKTNYNKEERILVTGVNCNSETALQEMQKIKEKYNKVTGGNTAYHAYQSFKTGEVSAEESYKIGLELAQKMFPEYQVVVTTHLNTGTYHNHFVINSVNMFTGEKFNCNKGAYYRFRGISDELCRKHNLIVIEHPKGKTPTEIARVMTAKNVKLPCDIVGISKIKLKILNLSDFPELYVEISDLNNLNRKYHRIVIKNYVVLYTIDYKNKKVFISHMYYGRRNYINNLLF